MSSYRRVRKTALFCALITLAACRSSDPAGVWEIQTGSTAKGDSYVGVVHFDKGGDHWKAAWNTSFDDQEGIAVQEGPILAACYAERNRPAELWIVKRRADGSAVLIVHRAQGRTESALSGGTGTLTGTFKIGESGDTLTITQGAESMDLSRGGKSRTMRAVGLAGDGFVAGAAGDFAGIAFYTIRGGTAEGRRYSAETGLRIEKLERASTGSMNVKFKGRFKP